MKKVLFLLPLLLLASCNMGNYKVNNIRNLDLSEDDSLTLEDLSSSQILAKINGNGSFPLVFYSNTCSSCLEAIKTVSAYALKYGTKFYSLKYSQHSYSILNETYRYIFPEGLVYPVTMIIKNKTLAYTINKDNMESLEAFEPVAKQHFNDCNISYCSLLNAYLNYQNNYSDYVCFIYSSLDQNDLSFLETVKNYSTDTSKNLILIDKIVAETGLISYLDIPDGNQNCCFEIKNNQRTRVADYSKDEGKELVKNFFLAN